MLLEIAASEGRGSLRGICRHWGSQGKGDTVLVQTAQRGAPEVPFECARGRFCQTLGATGPGTQVSPGPLAC